MSNACVWVITGRDVEIGLVPNPGPGWGWSFLALPAPAAFAADAAPLLNLDRDYDVHYFPSGMRPLEFFRRVMRSLKTEVLAT